MSKYRDTRWVYVAGAFEPLPVDTTKPEPLAYDEVQFERDPLNGEWVLCERPK
jgi:hypothetical protein